MRPSPPHRLLYLCCAGKRNDEENAKEKLFTYASHVPVDTFKVRLVLLLLKGFCFDLPVMIGSSNCDGRCGVKQVVH